MYLSFLRAVGSVHFIPFSLILYNAHLYLFIRCFSRNTFTRSFNKTTRVGLLCFKSSQQTILPVVSYTMRYYTNFVLQMRLYVLLLSISVRRKYPFATIQRLSHITGESISYCLNTATPSLITHDYSVQVANSEGSVPSFTHHTVFTTKFNALLTLPFCRQKLCSIRLFFLSGEV